MTGADLAREVSTQAPYTVSPPDGVPVRYQVAAVDLGIKTATPLAMARHGCQVTVLPAASTTEDILACGPDGVFFSNGPGDPAAAGYAVDAVRGVLARGVPVFGICLGSQVLGRALGLGTYKLRFGHRGVNQPVKDLATGQVQITSHNHGFAVAMPAAGRPARPARRRRPARPARRRARRDVRHRLRPGPDHPRQPQRRRGRGAAAARGAGVQRPVPPGGRAGPARCGRAV